MKYLQGDFSITRSGLCTRDRRVTTTKKAKKKEKVGDLRYCRQ
jgi:hypothetical protein